jgi:hypothetical protein
MFRVIPNRGREQNSKVSDSNVGRKIQCTEYSVQNRLYLCVGSTRAESANRTFRARTGLVEFRQNHPSYHISHSNRRTCGHLSIPFDFLQGDTENLGIQGRWYGHRFLSVRCDNWDDFDEIPLNLSGL